MNGFPTTADIYRVLPELLWCGFGTLLMVLQPFVKGRKTLATVAFLGAALGTAGTFSITIHSGAGFYGLVQSDPFSVFFHLLIGLVACLVVLAAAPYLERSTWNPPSSTRWCFLRVPAWAC